MNSTLFVQNTTDVLYICTDTAENMYYFWLTKREQFPSMSDFSLGFLQNLLSNGIRLKQINDKLIELQEESEADPTVDNDYKYYYYMGRIARLLLVFDPVTDELDRLNSVRSSEHNLLPPVVKQSRPAYRGLKRLKQGNVEADAHVVSDPEYEPLDTMTGLESFSTPLGFIDFV